MSVIAAPPKKTERRLLWGPESASLQAGGAQHRERWRRRTWQLHLSVLLSHVYAFVLFLGHCQAGYAPWHAVLLYGLWIGGGMAFITWAYASGWSQTRRDPGLFLAHQLIAITGVLGLLVAAPQVAFQALVMLLVFSADGFLARRRTSFWLTWGATLIAVAVVVVVQGPQMRMTTDTPLGQALAIAVVVGGVFRCSLLVTYFRGMQYRLRAANEQLGEALAQIEALVRSDDLTGVANRRGVTERLHQCMEAAQRQGTPLCVALLDIDHFKQINDRYGHDGGDSVLRAFGQLLAAQLRATDGVGRYGGEEFLLLLPDTTLEQARVQLERIRTQALQLPWAQMGLPALQVSCTVGASQYRPGDPLEAAISRADAAMYAGKTAGRNRVVLEAVAPSPSSSADAAPEAATHTAATHTAVAEAPRPALPEVGGQAALF